MVKFFIHYPNKNIVDFIDSAIDSDKLMNWLTYLEKLPENLRCQQLAFIKHRMIRNNEEDRVLDIMDSIATPEILHAINAVIKDVFDSGMRTRRFLKRNDNTNFNILMRLISGIEKI